MQFISFKSGWKTYATVALGIGYAIVSYINPDFHLPWVVEVGLGFLGLGFHRAATTKLSKDTSAAILSVMQVVKDLQVQVTISTQGQPSPSNIAEEQEQQITENLNKAQVGNVK